MKTILKYISRQFGNPTGFGGKISTFIMNCLNRKQYNAVAENIEIQQTDTILDIGFGNGYLIRKLSKKNPQKICGIEISVDMLNLVAKKNLNKIERGKVQLFLENVQSLPFERNSIDKAYTVNTVYFWQDIDKGFSEIERVLKPNGIFLNVLYEKKWLDKLPITQYGFSKYTVSQIEKTTTESGLKIESIIEIQRGKSVCVIARKNNASA